MTIHDHSRLAHKEEEQAGRFGTRHQEIIVELRADCGTDRSIKERLGYDEMNHVRPRITELIKQGIVEEIGSTKCHVTGKKVRVVSLKTKQGEFSFDEE